jgi:hypothetical protein
MIDGFYLFTFFPIDRLIINLISWDFLDLLSVRRSSCKKKNLQRKKRELERGDEHKIIY